jgi:hypothetical protein
MWDREEYTTRLSDYWTMASVRRSPRMIPVFPDETEGKGGMEMELLHASPATIWRLLIPKKHWLFAEDVDEEELVFLYRDFVYFVNEDGSVLSLPKPKHLEYMDLGDLYDHLAEADDTFDFDDHGMFDYAEILQRMGYIVPTARTRERKDYAVEIVNSLDPERMVSRYTLKRVSFVFALYHALLRCRELNVKSDGLFEHEVKRVASIEENAMQKLPHFS